MTDVLFCYHFAIFCEDDSLLFLLKSVYSVIPTVNVTMTIPLKLNVACK
jgi:hypothetical protein